MTEFVTPPDQLLLAAERVLRGAGFSSKIETLEPTGQSWLLAEDEMFVVAVIAGRDLDQLRAADARATDTLLTRLGGLDAGAKRWDAYLVMLSHSLASANEGRSLLELQYNTRGLRRLVGVGLQAEERAVARILTPFLPFPEPPSQSLGEVYAELIDALVVNGIAADDAARFVAAFQRSGALDGV